MKKYLLLLLLFVTFSSSAQTFIGVNAGTNEKEFVIEPNIVYKDAYFAFKGSYTVSETAQFVNALAGINPFQGNTQIMFLWGIELNNNLAAKVNVELW